MKKVITLRVTTSSVCNRSLLTEEDSQAATVLHDMRMTWNKWKLREESSGKHCWRKLGTHALIKEKMRAQRLCVYGGEMSAHHYFRDFGYCDSRMIPCTVIELILDSTISSSNLSALAWKDSPLLEEINRKIADPEQAIARVLSCYQKACCKHESTSTVLA
ncbi:hypothetical protein OK016_20365 [Vibrio chagasii]|nr:hypothetical protein [Vibrio chagasii]